jgi:2,3,4,5-tetrahydropyridine-2,6-dicarboxylate N-succinyltransferase
MSTANSGLSELINRAFETRNEYAPDRVPAEVAGAVETVMEGLESGQLRVAEAVAGGWHVNEWIKKAVLLYFRINATVAMPASPANFYDKVPLRFAEAGDEQFKAVGARIVPGAVIRRGAHVASNVVVMPSFINIGAYVGAGTMVDTWATVGSCAQIGRNVHLSGGAGIGGVLEPLQAAPTIIEDDCFIGARSEVVEGVIVERGSVIGMGVFLGQSTRIYDRASKTVSYGRVPAGSVVVAGSLPAADGSHSLYAAIIVKRVDERTRAKTSLNELLRE